MLRFESKYGLEGFNGIADIYDALLSDAKYEFLMLSFESLKIWVEIIGDIKNVVSLIAYDENRVIGLALLYVNKIKLKGIIPHSQIRFLADDLSDWNDFIITENRDKVTEGFINILLENNYSEVLLKNLDEKSLTLESLKKICKPENLTVKESSKCYYINLKKFTKEDYFNTEVSKKFVTRDLNRLYNHLNGCEWKIVKLEQAEIEKYIDTLIDMHIGIKKKKDIARTYEDDKYARLVKEITLASSRKNTLSVYSLLIDGNIAAYMVLHKYGKKYYWWNTSYNAEYHKYSPSKVLLNEIIRKCFDEEMEEFSFMRGESDYKTKWTKSYTANYQVRYLSGSGLSGFFRMLRGIK